MADPGWRWQMASRGFRPHVACDSGRRSSWCTSFHQQTRLSRQQKRLALAHRCLQKKTWRWFIARVGTTGDHILFCSKCHVEYYMPFNNLQSRKYSRHMTALRLKILLVSSRLCGNLSKYQIRVPLSQKNQETLQLLPCPKLTHILSLEKRFPSF